MAQGVSAAEESSPRQERADVGELPAYVLQS